MAFEDRVSLKNLASSGGFKQLITGRRWTPLEDENGIVWVTMPDGSTLVKVWISFTQPSLNKPKNFQFRIVRKGGDFTARKSILMPTLTDVGLIYEWELNTGPTNPSTISVEVWHDGGTTTNPGVIQIDAYEAHYKHIPEVIIK